MEHSYKERERKGGSTKLAGMHTHTHTHPTLTYADVQYITGSPKVLKACMHRMRTHTHALGYSDANRVLGELMELRHGGLETGSCARLGEGQRDGAREDGSGGRIAQHWHAYENTC